MSLPIERRKAPRRRSPSASRLLAWLFLAAGGAVIGLFLLQVGAFNALRPRPPASAGVATPAMETEAVAEPAGTRTDQVAVAVSQFTGFDKQRQPFSVKAQRAVQDRSDASKVHLERVVAELKRISGEEIAISSLTALYDADRKSIDLDGEVELSSSDRFVARMARASVTIDNKQFMSQSPVTVTHERGEIRANGMVVSDEGRRIVFFNRVRATFWGTAGREGEQQ